MDTQKLEDELINKLRNFKQVHTNLVNELAVSIRKDVVAVELKDIISNSTDYDSLKSLLEQYIENLYKVTNEEG